MAETTIEHVVSPAGQIHVPHQWTFPDAATRVGAICVARDLNKIALQFDDGSYWRLAGVSPTLWVPARSIYTPQILSAALTIYVRLVANGGNDANNGLTMATAVATINRAWQLAAGYSVNANGIRILLADSAQYNQDFVCAGLLPGSYANGGPLIYPVSIEGNGSALTTLHGDTAAPGSWLGAVSENARVIVRNLKLTSTDGNGVNASDGGLLEIGSDIEFGSMAGQHIAAFEKGIVYRYTDYKISGGTDRHLYTWGNGYMEGGATVTLTGVPAFRIFAQADEGSLIVDYSTYVGGATGQRFQVTNHSHMAVHSEAGDLNYLPGDTDGFVEPGSGYNDVYPGLAPSIFVLQETIFGAMNASAPVTQAMLANRVYLVPFWAEDVYDLGYLSPYITIAGAAGKSVWTGIYANVVKQTADPNPVVYDSPGALLVSGSTAANATGLRTIQQRQRLFGGVKYWVAIKSDGTPTLNSIPFAALRQLGGYNGATPSIGGFFYDYATAGLPADLTAIDITGSQLSTGALSGIPATIAYPRDYA